MSMKDITSISLNSELQNYLIFKTLQKNIDTYFRVFKNIKNIFISLIKESPLSIEFYDAQELKSKFNTLNCLYNLTKILENNNKDISQTIQEIVDFIPTAWECPDKVCAFINLNNQIFKTKNFKITPWYKKADLSVYFERIGVIKVFFLEEYIKEKNLPIINEVDGFIAIVNQINKVVEIIQAREKKENLIHNLYESQKMETISTLAGEIAHEFNNTLFGITGNIELIQNKIPDKSIEKYISQVLNSCQRITNLINNLLVYSKGTNYNPEKIDLNIHIKDNFSLMKQNINQNINLEMILTPNLPMIKGDISQINVVISTVLRNAINSLDGKGSVRIKSFAKDQSVCIMVEDTGKGLGITSGDKRFKPFFTSNYGRLDMFLCHGIIYNHNGWIKCDFEHGKGNTVCIGLPI